ncbi:MAG TPA: LuxR family transcriptional regulator, partial [Gemmatimonadetes bacterium]|nr:LuxR family transcriptional regulator [Gemmatimonadota bacterium]
MSAAAERWLSEVSDADWPALRELPSVVLGVAVQLQAQDSGRSAESSGARLRTRSGVWLTVRGSRLSGIGVEGQIAVVVAPAAPIEMASMIMQAYDLTQREREVTGLVLQGTSTKEVGAALRISG